MPVPTPIGSRALGSTPPRGRARAPRLPRVGRSECHIHSHGHTRLPRYARGKRGVIHRCHGIHVFPDTNGHGPGEQPQRPYSLRFDAWEPWGEAAEPKQVVHLDLWG